VLLQLMQSLIKSQSRDDKIAKERFINNLIKIIKQIMTKLVTTYFLALFWYRFSDYLQKFLGLGGDTDDSDYFVVVFGLRPPTSHIDNPRLSFTRPKSLESLAAGQRLLFGTEEWSLPDSEPVPSTVHSRLITIMYYALTTLSTVGYGDYFPCSISEKIIGAVI
jgi:hypothetical protein